MYECMLVANVACMLIVCMYAFVKQINVNNLRYRLTSSLYHLSSMFYFLFLLIELYEDKLNMCTIIYRVIENNVKCLEFVKF